MEIKDGKDYIPQVKELIIEYTKQLGRDLSFQNIDEELADPAHKYTAPEGELLVAERDGEVIGMVAYHRHNDTRCEMKRLYVKPEARGLHLGDKLVTEIIAHAMAAGYSEMVLDTIVPLKSAIALYKKHGFEECEPYYNNPMDDVIYMRKDLEVGMDEMISVSAAGGQLRAVAINGKSLVEYARGAHHLSPVATAALGRLLCGTVMMGRELLKNEGELITVQIDGDGPLGGLLATADHAGHVKGYVKNPAVIVPDREDGHLNVGAAVGAGTISVSRDMGGDEPYSGTVPLVSGEIAEDINYYFAASEQILSAVGLGVLVGRDRRVEQAGGFIVQLMPDADEETISRLEENIKNLPHVTEMLKSEASAESLLRRVLVGFDVHVLENIAPSFSCNCSRERVENALLLLGKGELDAMIADNKGEELKCHFCNKAYRFSIEELKTLRERV